MIFENNTFSRFVNQQESHIFTLKNGEKIIAQSGYKLPSGLNDTFKFYIPVHEYIKIVASHPIFIEITLGEWNDGCDLVFKLDDVEPLLRGIYKCILDTMKNFEKIYEEMSKGNKEFVKKWANFCDDCRLMMIYCYVRKEIPVMITLYPPKIDSDNKFTCPIYYLEKF